MHAFLIESKNYDENKLVQFSAYKKIIFEVAKINDVRSLNSFLKFSPQEPTLLVLNKLDEASTEAQNSLLKTIEEPPKNVAFLIVVKSSGGILPTILSRVQIVRSAEEKYIETKNTFSEMSKTEQLSEVNKIKDRDQAKEFLESIIENGNGSLNAREKASETLLKIKKNGNVGLSLLWFVVYL